MSLLKTERIVMVTLPDLTPVAHRLIDHFRAGGRDATGQPCMVAGYGHYMPASWEITILERTFRPIGRFRTALKMQLVPQAGTTMIRISAGILGIPVGHEQLSWKVRLGQLWRDVKKSGFHDDALLVAEEFLTEAGRLLGEPGGQLQPTQPWHGQASHVPPAGGSAQHRPAHQQLTHAAAYCAGCGAQLAQEARFCPGCGSQRT